jgi:hypothetical protein
MTCKKCADLQVMAVAILRSDPIICSVGTGNIINGEKRLLLKRLFLKSVTLCNYNISWCTGRPEGCCLDRHFANIPHVWRCNHCHGTGDNKCWWSWCCVGAQPAE